MPQNKKNTGGRPRIYNETPVESVARWRARLRKESNEKFYYIHLPAETDAKFRKICAAAKPRQPLQQGFMAAVNLWIGSQTSSKPNSHSRRRGRHSSRVTRLV